LSKQAPLRLTSEKVAFAREQSWKFAIAKLQLRNTVPFMSPWRAGLSATSARPLPSAIVGTGLEKEARQIHVGVQHRPQ